MNSRGPIFKNTWLCIASLCIASLMAAGSGAPAAWAGVFTMPHFVEPEQFSLGLEPEFTFSGGDSGIGINAKYTQGISDLLNATGLIGTGSGPRQFRVGGAAVFDFFPDVEGQPGVGVGAQAIYYRRKDFGRLEITAVPYIHKAFISDSGTIEPFAALPFGVGMRSDGNDGLLGVAIGALFGKSEHFKYVAELGIDVNHTDTYVSGGIAYYH